MKKLLLKISMFLSVLLVSTSLAGMSTFASAQVISSKDLQTKFNLKTIALKNIPTNVTPFKFDTIAEANTFLAEQEALPKVINLTKNSNSINQIQALSTTGYQTKTALQAGLVFYKIGVNYTSNGSSFVSCSSVTGYITGVTLGNGYTQLSKSSSIIDRGRTLTAHSYGVHTMYLIIAGIGQVASQSLTLYSEFYL